MTSLNSSPARLRRSYTQKGRRRRSTATGFPPERRAERFLSGALFTTPEPGQTGSERNLFTGPGYFQVDLGIFKNFPVGKKRLEIPTEIFNLFDTVNFSDPNPLASSANFGTITDTRVPPRIIQLGIKWYF